MSKWVKNALQLSLLLFLFSSLLIGCNPNNTMSLPPSPTTTNPLETSARIVQLAPFQQNSFALTDKGELFGWGGRNEEGELGIGNTETTKKPTKLNINDKIIQISPGAFSVALTEGGKIYTWGITDYGDDLGNERTFTATPLKKEMPEKIVKLGEGAGVGLAISETGSLYTWGWNYYGERGDGTRKRSNFTPHEVNLPQRVMDASYRGTHVLALLEDGSVYAWGTNYFGEIGDQTPVAYKPGEAYDENVVVLKPYKVHFDKKIIAITSGNGTSYALDEDGTLYAWGQNLLGQLGIGDEKVAASSTPLKVAIPRKIKIVKSGEDLVYAIAEDGTVYEWGKKKYKPEVIQIPGEVDKISVSFNTWVITKDGEIYGWGNNQDGQLGPDLPEVVHTPTKIDLKLKD
ncbi:MAG: hypothetical protein RBR24_01170 [Candidatus Carbobacillus sp.]|nr:hypothetical protein [Candidatus Carbobacillus sp.]